MGLGSSSLTMVELVRAYSAFATYGRLVEPHWINRVEDRDGTVIEEWTPPADGWPEAIPPGVATVPPLRIRSKVCGMERSGFARLYGPAARIIQAAALASPGLSYRPESEGRL
jgi:membrane peptidoglycan carboxypeptidase